MSPLMACVLVLFVVASVIGLGWYIGGLRVKRTPPLPPPTTFEDKDGEKKGLGDLW